MVDQALETLEQYELEVKDVRRGRGSWVIASNRGDFMLKEYRGDEEKARLQRMLTDRITKQTGVVVQEIVPSREGTLLVRDKEEHSYVLETYMEGRECNLREPEENAVAIRTMARMHGGMILEQKPENVACCSLAREFAKRNTELRRIRRYLKEKRQKNNFERYLHKHFNLFFEKALEVEADWAHYEPYALPAEGSCYFCHGDYQHHNVWFHYQDVMILQFEKYMCDMPCRDLYLYLRKLLEKNNWDQEIGRGAIALYEKERPLTHMEHISMVYRFAYPEKFWKIANYYFNSRKSFMPEKNMDKLEKLLQQEKAKEYFIDKTLKAL